MAYTQSDKVNKAEKDYYSHIYGNKPGAFSSENTEKANAALKAYEDRGEFKYDPATDSGYQAARKQYTEGGKQAMKDTLGTATELTGGYDNSYAQAAAQQTYNKYMGELAALMPQYEQQAYGRYQDEGQQMIDYYGILKNAEAQDYAMHRDKVGDFNAEADRLYGVYADEKNFDYGGYIDDRNYDYQVEQDAIANDQWERTFAHQKAQDDAAAEVARTNAQTDYYEALAKKQAATTNKSYYKDWEADDWESYFAQIRQEEGRAAAEEELKYFTENGLIPDNMVSIATVGVRGSNKGH